MPKKRGGGENLFQRDGVWYTRIQIGGRDIKRSLRTTVFAEAKKRREKILKAAKHVRFHGEERHTWKDAVVEWAKDAPQTISLGTLKRYLVSIGQLRGILDRLYLDEISSKTISQIARRGGVSNATRRRDITAVSAVLRWCVAHEWREDNPAKSWDRDVIKERRDPIVLPADYAIACVIAAAPGNFARMIRWAQYTGMREEECASLERPEISLPRKAAQLHRAKTNRPRSVPLDERAMGVLSATPVSLKTKFVFWHEPNRRGSNDPNAYRYSNVASRFRATVKNAQRKPEAQKQPVPNAFRFHDLRHWYAVDYLRSGGSIYALQQILGHTSIKTTELYLDYLTPAEQLIAKRVGTEAGSV